MEPALERNLQKSNELKKKSHAHNGILWIPKLSWNLEATLYIPGDFKAATTRHHTCHCGRFGGILSKKQLGQSRFICIKLFLTYAMHAL